VHLRRILARIGAGSRPGVHARVVRPRLDHRYSSGGTSAALVTAEPRFGAGYGPR